MPPALAVETAGNANEVCLRRLPEEPPAREGGLRSGCPRLQSPGALEGCLVGNGLLMGTYLHGLFENRCLRRAVVDWLVERRGLPPVHREDPKISREAEYDRLADCLRRHIDLPAVYEILGAGG